MGSFLVGVNGVEVWAYVVEQDHGFHVRFGLDDWHGLNFGTGQRISVRLPGMPDEWLFVTHVTELPPVVWVTMAKRVSVTT